MLGTNRLQVIRNAAFLRQAGGLAACFVAFAGCSGGLPQPAVPGPAVVFNAPPPQPGRPPGPPPVLGAQQDARVKGTAATGETIASSLAIIHDNLKQLKRTQSEQKEISGDLKRVAEMLRPQIESARAYCDALERAAKDLKVQLPLEQAGYLSAATSYKQRAEGYRDKDLKEITIRLADEFSWLASDTPRRIELTDSFLKNLTELKEYLSESERCVRDTATALDIFSSRGGAPTMEANLKGFNARLGQFIQAVIDYEEKLLHKPTNPPPARATREVPHAAGPAKSKPVPPSTTMLPVRPDSRTPEGQDSGTAAGQQNLLHGRAAGVPVNIFQKNGLPREPHIRVINPRLVSPLRELVFKLPLADPGVTARPLLRLKRERHFMVADIKIPEHSYVFRIERIPKNSNSVDFKWGDENESPEEGGTIELNLLSDRGTGTWKFGDSSGPLEVVQP